MRWRADINIWLSTPGVALVSLALTHRWWRARLARVRECTWISGALVGAASGIATVGATHLIFNWAGADSTLHDAAACLYAAVAAVPRAALGIAVVLLVVGAEEVVWRGLALDALRELGAVGAVAGTALWYALPMVIAGEGWLALAAMALGLTWAALRLLTGTFMSAYVAHATWTLGILFVWPLSPA